MTKIDTTDKYIHIGIHKTPQSYFTTCLLSDQISKFTSLEFWAMFLAPISPGRLTT